MLRQRICFILTFVTTARILADPTNNTMILSILIRVQTGNVHHLFTNENEWTKLTILVELQIYMGLVPYIEAAQSLGSMSLRAANCLDQAPKQHRSMLAYMDAWDGTKLDLHFLFRLLYHHAL